MLNGYDIIGDIHGCAARLEALLARLGYSKIDGAWTHPDRMVIFLGDYIDRGPQILETLGIVRAMRDAGSAECLMGNHEFNAVCWHTPDPERPGHWLRPHSEKNLAQHAATLEQLAGCTQPWIDWMRTLPLWLEVGDLGGRGGRLHLAHACWSPDDMRVLLGAECLGEKLLTGRSDAPRMTHAGYVCACDPGSGVYRAIENILKGPEADLPEGAALQDKDGFERRRMRVKWWLEPAGTCRDMAMMGAEEIASIPVGAAPAPDAWKAIPVEYPTFFGHYWRSPSEDVRIYDGNTVCLDFSAVKGGPLVAYRWNRGDTCLRNDRFVRVGGDGQDDSPQSRRVFFP